MRKKIPLEWWKAKFREYDMKFQGIPDNMTKFLKWAQNGSTNHREEAKAALAELEKIGHYRYVKASKKYIRTDKDRIATEQFARESQALQNPGVKQIYDKAMQQLHDKGTIKADAFDIEEMTKPFEDKDNLLDLFFREKEKFVQGLVIAWLEKGKSREDILRELDELVDKTITHWKENPPKFRNS